jgi:hypothetical protein
MLAAGYSAKVTKKDQQGVSALENFAERDLFTINSLQSKAGCRRIFFEFQVLVPKYQIKLRFAQMSL